MRERLGSPAWGVSVRVGGGRSGVRSCESGAQTIIPIPYLPVKFSTTHTFLAHRCTKRRVKRVIRAINAHLQNLPTLPRDQQEPPPHCHKKTPRTSPPITATTLRKQRTCLASVPSPYLSAKKTEARATVCLTFGTVTAGKGSYAQAAIPASAAPARDTQVTFRLPKRYSIRLLSSAGDRR